MANVFTYRDGDYVPPDVTRLIVHPSVRVLPLMVCMERRKLEEVQLPEGLEEIGSMAFNGCTKLRRLICPSTVVRIGSGAFWLCIMLTMVQLNEGLEEIGNMAFTSCNSLRRIDCPSTVVRLVEEAFSKCDKLEEVQLNEGLEEIGVEAFTGCDSMRRLKCPSTVVRMGARACWMCWKLSEVELGGIIKVEIGAFVGCCLLKHVSIPSRAFVLQRGADRNYTCCPVTVGTITPPSDEFVLIAPGSLAAVPESNLTELGDSICTIVNSDEGTEKDRLGRVRQELRKKIRGEVSAILGLAFWKAKIDEAERVHIDLNELGNSIRTIANGDEGTEKDRPGQVPQVVRKKIRGGVSAILGLAFWKAKVRQEVRKKIRGVVSAILGLAFCKAKTDEAERVPFSAAKDHRKNTGWGRERAKVDAVLSREAREGCRCAGKGKEIAQNVLPFLDDLW